MTTQAATPTEASSPAPIVRIDQVTNPPRRIDEYFGLWCVDAVRFMAMFSRVSTMDMPLHVASTSPKPSTANTTIVTVQPNDESDYVPPTAKSASGDPRTVDRKFDSQDIPTGSIALIMVEGVLMKQVGSLEDGSSTIQLRRDIRTAAKNSNIGAIMLLIDSPGGTVAGTADLADEIAAAAKQKPVYAFVEDFCASAAYWCASACTKIFANNPTAMVGSIGTYAGLYDYSGAAGQMGIKAKLYSSGKLKGAGFPGTEITPEQDAYFQKLIEDTQTHFAAAVAKNRGMTSDQVKNVATGAVFLASDALSSGLIDGIKSYDETIAALEAAMNRKSAGGRISSASSTTTEVAMTTTTSSPSQAAEAGKPAEAGAGGGGASLKELKAALPKANAEFLVKAMEDGLTVPQAKDRYIAQVETERDDAKAAAGKVGTAPITTRATGSEAEGCDDFEQLVSAKLKANPNMERRKAIAEVAKANQDAHKAYLESMPTVQRTPPRPQRAARAKK